jgi:hypothetical protein
LATPTLSVALQLTVWTEPTGQVSLPTGAVTVATGGVWSVPVSTVKVCPFEVPPAGAGVTTVIVWMPVVTRSDAGIEAVIWFAPT